MYHKLLAKILLPLLFFILHSATSFSQQNNDNTKQSFAKAIAEIEKIHDVRFSYHTEAYDSLQVSLKELDIPLDSLLQQLKEELPIEFEKLSDRFITIKQVVSPKKTKAKTIIEACIIDGASKEPLPFAGIQIKDTNKGTTSKEDGTFQLEVNPDEHKVLMIHYLGYTPKMISVESLLQNPKQKISLLASVNQLQETIIRQYVTKGIEINEASDEIILSPNAMGMLPGMTENDVLHMVQLLPGISSINESVSNINIRGGTPDQNLVLWEGITQYSSGHFFGYFSSLNQNSTQKVIVQKDHFNSEFGGRSAGVIQMIGMDEIPSGFKGSFRANLMHSDATVQVPIGNKLAFFVSGRRSYFDLIQNKAFRKLTDRAIQNTQNKSEWDETQDDNDVVYYDVSTKLLYKTKGAKLSFSAYQVSNQMDLKKKFSNFEYDEDTDDDPIFEHTLNTLDQVDIENYGLSARADFSLIKGMQNITNATYTKYFSHSNGNITSFDTDNDIESENRSSNNSVADFDLQIINILKPLKKDSLRFGYELKRLDAYYKILFESKHEDDYSLESDQLEQSFHSLFFQYKYPFGKRANLHLGYRHTFENEITSSFHEPRAMISIKLSPHISYRMRAGVYKQYINQVIDFSESGLAEKTWKLISKDDNNLLSSTNYSSGLLYSRNGFQFEIDAYHKRSKGVNVMSFTFSNNRNVDRDVFEEASGKTTGIDVLVKKRIRNVNIWASYSYSRNELRLNQENDEGSINSRSVFAPQDQRHKGDLSLQYKKKQFDFVLSWHYRSGKPYTKALDIITVDDDHQIRYDEINGDRLKDYHKLNLSAMYSLPLKNRISAKFGLSVSNVYNRKNPLSINYYIDENNGTPVLLQNKTFLLQRMVNVSARISW